MACCGRAAGTGGPGLQYEVTTSKGNVYTVNTTAEARLKITSEAGGPGTATYKAVPKK